MKRRRTKDYAKLLEILVKEAQKLGYMLKPGQAMIDFELAANKAYEKVFVGIVVKGCLFHFGQSLFRKFCSLGLKSREQEVQDWFKAIFCLSLIPIAHVIKNSIYYRIK